MGFPVTRKQSKYQLGFSVLEMLVVIVIMVILVTISILSYEGMVDKATVSSIQLDLTNAAKKLKIYQTFKGKYPTAIDCNAAPAANSICISFSSGNELSAYTYDNSADPKSFNLTIRNGDVAYAVTQNTGPQVAVVVPKPSVPSSIVATAGSGQIVLTWTTPANADGSTVTGYEVYSGTSTNPTTLTQTVGAVNTYTITGLTQGSTYYVRMKTISTSGTSDFSGNSSATITVVGNIAFSYTGAIQTWTVPALVTSVTITAKGAQGGQAAVANVGGLGASVSGVFAVTPGQVLSILVGQQPAPNLGLRPGGGGGTFVALGSSYATATPMIVAGGGGGSFTGGAGQAGQILNVTTTGNGGGPVPGTSGNGAASTSCGGGGGGFYTSGGNDTLYPTKGVGGAGFRQGGAGGVSASYQVGGFGGGATADYDGSCNFSAGSGGGYSGGSGYNATTSNLSGYGGGSYNSGTSQVNTAGANSGNGSVTITWGS